jgi:hypothetical protein
VLEVPGVSQDAMADAVEEAGLESFPAADAPAWGDAAKGELNTDLRAVLQRHWRASDAGDFDAEHDIYDDEAVLDYPQSGERIRGWTNIQASRMAQPNKKRFTLRRMRGDWWSLDERARSHVRRSACVRREHHGVRGREGRAGDPVFRRTIRAWSISRALGQ